MPLHQLFTMAVLLILRYLQPPPLPQPPLAIVLSSNGQQSQRRRRHLLPNLLPNMNHHTTPAWFHLVHEESHLPAVIDEQALEVNWPLWRRKKKDIQPIADNLLYEIRNINHHPDMRMIRPRCQLFLALHLRYIQKCLDRLECQYLPRNLLLRLLHLPGYPSQLDREVLLRSQRAQMGQVKS